MSEPGKTGLIYDIQGFSVQDGPGIRTTVFLKGCPLKCPWCHSPESQSFKKQLSFMKMRCVGTEKCGTCLSACREGAVLLAEKEYSEAKKEMIRHIRIDTEKCTECLDCTKRCFPGALEASGKEYTVKEVLERVRKDIPFYSHSEEGGVTVSGGEAMSQFEFTLELLQALKKEGIHTALDTTGFAPTEHIREVIPFTDLFLYDIKHMNSEKHNEWVKVPNDLILENARMIAENGGAFQIRMPVIPTFNDDDENFRRFGEFVVSLGQAVRVVQLLPYHRFGDVKYERLHRKPEMPDGIEPPSEASILKRAAQLRKLGLTVTVH